MPPPPRIPPPPRWHPKDDYYDGFRSDPEYASRRKTFFLRDIPPPAERLRRALTGESQQENWDFAQQRFEVDKYLEGERYDTDLEEWVPIPAAAGIKDDYVDTWPYGNPPKTVRPAFKPSPGDSIEDRRFDPPPETDPSPWINPAAPPPASRNFAGQREDSLDSLRSTGKWVRAGRWEINTVTRERRPIPGMELGPEAESVKTPSSLELASLSDVGKSLLAGVAKIPGRVVDAAEWASGNPVLSPGNYLADKILPGAAEKRAAEFKSLRDPVAAMLENPTSVEAPKFSDQPLKAAMMGAAQSLPETLGIALTGGAGQAYSTATQADAAHREMRSRGVPEYIAYPTSFAVGAVQGLLDRVGAENAFKGVSGNILGRIVKGAGIEATTEAAQELVGIAGESLTGKDQDARDVRERIAAAFSSALISGGALGASPRIEGVNIQRDAPAAAQAIEERIFPDRRVSDYAKEALKDPRLALGRALVDAGQSVSPQLKREMILDPQTELSLKGEWDKAKDRINADPEAAVIRLDLDGVKAGNDNLGHPVADKYIFRPMADQVHAIADKYGIGERLRFRAGGDEFILVAPRGIASQVVDDLKEATAPRFAPVPDNKAIEAGIPPGEAFVQYGASVGWGMDDHSADEEVYKVKATKPERGKLIRREKAVEMVINHEAQQAVAPPVEAEPAIQAGRPTITAREALAGSGVLMGVPVETVNAAIEGASALLARAGKARQKYFTAESDRPGHWMRAKEEGEQIQRAAKLETDFIVSDYGKALKAELKNGAAPEEINHAAKEYLQGNKKAPVPAGMRPVLDRMRTYLDESVTQELINSGVVKNQAQAQAYLKNKGEWLYRAFRMHVEPEFKKSMVGTPTFDRAVDYTVNKEDDFLRGVVDSRNSLAAEYEGRAKVLAWQEQKAQELIARRESMLAEAGQGQGEFVAGQRAQNTAALGEATAFATTDRESTLAKAGTAADAALTEAEASYRDDMAALEEYESLFGAQSPGLGWAKARLKSEHVEAKQATLRGERAQAKEAGSEWNSTNRSARAEYGDSSRQVRDDAGFAAMAMEADIRKTIGAEMGQVFAESNLPNTGGPLDYGKKSLRSRIALEREALRQRYAKKLGIAKNRAAWAERKIAENTANPDRRAEVAGRVEEMITFDPRPLDPKSLQGMSRAWLTKRKDIPKEYLDVMGVYEDPVASFVIASERAARTIGKRRMWDDIVMGSDGKEISVGKPMPGLARPIEGVTFTDQNGVEQPVYTSDELYESLNEAFDVGHQSTFLSRAVGLTNGALKASATVLSVPGAARNFWSSFIPLAANGNLLPGMYRHGKSALKVAAANAGWGAKEWRQEAIEAARHGIVGSTVDTRDLERYFKSITQDPTTKTPLRSAYRFAKDFYSFGDNWAKMVTWKMERDRYAEAMDLPRTDPQVMARAAEVTKRVIQNYDRLPVWAKEVRDSPVIGPFVSFPAAVISNVGGSMQTIAEDIRSENPKIKAAGWKRAAHFSAAMSGLAFGEALMKSAFKDPEDEERDQEVIDDIRPLLPAWQRDSQMLLYDKSPGYLRYYDMSFLNYYGTVTEPIAMLLRGDLSLDALPSTIANIGWATARKIFGEELGLGAYADLTRGPVGGGPEVVNEEMSPGLALLRTAKWAMRNIAPGTLRTLYRAFEAEPGHRLGELLALSGVKLTTINLGKALDYSLYALTADRDAIQASIKSAAKSTSTLSIPELGVNTSGYIESMNSIYSKAIGNYQRAVRQGANPSEARNSISEKLDKPGKIMMALVNSGATPEVAVERAVAFEWQKRRVALLKTIAERQREALEEYKGKYSTATFDEIERQRKYLEQWAASARQVVNEAGKPKGTAPAGPGGLN